MNEPFDEAARDAVYRAIHERRDMRHFTREPVAQDALKRIVDAALCAPSVGFMQPWRMLRITCDATREALHAIVERERVATADALGERRDAFMALKVEGMRECAEIIVMALMDGREAHVFGRRTLPQMDLASVACAIQNMWLAARVEGIGMGWVSIFDPDDVADLLGMPEGAQPVAILCMGHVERFYDEPMLETEGWAKRRTREECVFENRWPAASDQS
ncbi:5,6-dimethylbenzimidazole synthase [Caballeronia sp. GAWG2-1]|uniref:5,6-dimethylbenzimidazole synthase n=1 Tax=Caballeronia sp. GAWG2-1 TaxID=2921744 RepID=UPI0020289A0E|nr:5,6-dimethylbenzimidazole synthase [Caballeronia sp. GAWG2-1]